MLTIEELLNISPEFRERFRKESTPRRVSIKEMEKERKVAMNTNIQIEEPFTSESKIEEVFVQGEHSEEILKEIPNASNLTNHVESTAPKEVDAFGKEMEGYIRMRRAHTKIPGFSMGDLLGEAEEEEE